MIYNCMTSRVTVSTDGGKKKTLTGVQADRVKAGVERHLKRGTAAPIKPGKHMTSRRGRAPQQGGAELVAGDVSFDESVKISRQKLAQKVLDEWNKQP